MGNLNLLYTRLRRCIVLLIIYRRERGLLPLVSLFFVLSISLGSFLVPFCLSLNPSLVSSLGIASGVSSVSSVFYQIYGI